MKWPTIGHALVIELALRGRTICPLLVLTGTSRCGYPTNGTGRRSTWARWGSLVAWCHHKHGGKSMTKRA
eukprot:10325173-Lingulodinium_polyedra.AAC.1